MTNAVLWKRMDYLARQEFSGEQQVAFMELLKTAYEEDLALLAAGIRNPGESDDIIHQAYYWAEGYRFLICYTSKEHAKKHAKKGFYLDRVGTYSSEMVRARDILGNLFNKDSIAGLVFNPDADRMVIVLKDLLQFFITGEKPKPPGFVDTTE